jgi:hypothetical protein
MRKIAAGSAAARRIYWLPTDREVQLVCIALALAIITLASRILSIW